MTNLEPLDVERNGLVQRGTAWRELNVKIYNQYPVQTLTTQMKKSQELETRHR